MTFPRTFRRIINTHLNIGNTICREKKVCDRLIKIIYAVGLVVVVDRRVGCVIVVAGAGILLGAAEAVLRGFSLVLSRAILLAGPPVRVEEVI